MRRSCRPCSARTGPASPGRTGSSRSSPCSAWRRRASGPAPAFPRCRGDNVPVRRSRQAEPAEDRVGALRPRELLRVRGGVDHPCVGAPGDHDQSAVPDIDDQPPGRRGRGRASRCRRAGPPPRACRARTRSAGAPRPVARASPPATADSPPDTVGTAPAICRDFSSGPGIGTGASSTGRFSRRSRKASGCRWTGITGRNRARGPGSPPAWLKCPWLSSVRPPRSSPDRPAVAAGSAGLRPR